jgi:drug/metabolite transporter (DMT)-like permease
MSVVLFGVFAALCYSTHDLIARSLAARLGPFRLAALTVVAGAAVLSLGIPWYDTVSRVGLTDSLLLGLAYGLGAVGLFKAFSLGPVSIVAPLTAAYPVLVFLWGLFAGLEPTPLQWAAVAATMLGAVIVSRSGGEGQGRHGIESGKFGIFAGFCLISVSGYTAAVLIGQKAAISIGVVQASWLSRPTALMAILPFLKGEPRAGVIAPINWVGILAMGALDVTGLSAINASGHYDGKEFAAIGISAYGAIAVVMAMIFLGERVSRGQWLGIGLIVGGVATLSTS